MYELVFAPMGIAIVRVSDGKVMRTGIRDYARAVAIVEKLAEVANA